MEEGAHPDPRHDLTLALRELGAGRGTSVEALLPELLAELRAVAAGCLGARGASHTLQPTALVNEAFLKLYGAGALDKIHDRGHFFALASRAMRQIVVDHARSRRAARSSERSGERRDGETTLAGVVEASPGEASPDEVLDVDAALTELAELDARAARVVELRFFAGLEVEEVALALDVSVSTVEREWRAARAWLGRRMRDRRAP